MADSQVKIRLSLEGSKAVIAGLQGIQSAALKLGAAIAGAAGLGALGAAAIQTAKLGGQLADLSARTGISTRSLILLRQAFADAGVGADAVGATVNKLQKTIIQAATAGGEAAEAFQVIGLSAAALSTLAPEEQFSQVAAAISAIENPAQRTAAAIAIFGKGAGELLPLFAEGGAIQNAEKVLGKMPDVLARNVPILDSISDSIDRLPNKATQLFAGILDQIGPAVQAVLDGFESIDLTSTGQRIGAFAAVAIEQFKAGRFGEFVGLTIEAGFEAGVESGSAILDRFASWIGSADIWKAVGNSLVTAINEAMKVAAGLILSLTVPFGAVADYIQDAIGYALQGAANLLATALEKVINSAANLINETFGTDLGTITFQRETAFKPPDFSKSWDLNKSGADAAKEWVGGFFDESTNAFRTLTDASTFTAGTGARDRLASMVSAQLAARDAQAAASTAPTGPRETAIPAVNTRLELQRLELDLAQRLQAIHAERGRVESSWLMTTNQKYAARKALIDQERVAIEGQIEALRNLRTLANEQEQMAIDRQVLGLEVRSAGLVNEATGMGPDPSSFAKQFQVTLIELQNQFGTVAQQMARTFADVFNAATASISTGIQGLIMGTTTWGRALINIGQSIVQSLVKSFADMVAGWIMSHVIMKGVSTAWASFQSALRAKDVAEANATEAAKTPALAGNALLASVGSFGVAAVIGAAAMAGILAAVGAFQSGGYTGDGPPGEVAGIVHRGEYVVPADAVERIGVGTLEAISSGSPMQAVAPVTGAPSPITMNMAVFDDPRRLADWARSQDGRAVIVDIFRQHAHELTAA